jgi:ribosomal-protein-alanine N-acetyltransferase
LKDTVMLTSMGGEDIDGIAGIEAASFTQPWGRRAILDELAVSGAVHIAARRVPAPQAGGALVGFILARILWDEMHIMKLAIDPAWRHRGVAAALLEAAQAQARRHGAVKALLEVRLGNTAAIEFYRKAGFATIGVRPNYYPSTGENALVMSKALKEVL